MNYALENIAYVNDPELNSIARRYEWLAWKYHPFYIMDMSVINSDIKGICIANPAHECHELWYQGHSYSQSSRDSEGLLYVKRIILFLFRFAYCKDIENRLFIVLKVITVLIRPWLSSFVKPIIKATFQVSVI